MTLKKYIFLTFLHFLRSLVTLGSLVFRLYLCPTFRKPNLLTFNKKLIMALVRNAANMIRRGRVGDATYYVQKGQMVVRQAKNDSNYGATARRSEAQQVRRVMWANLVNFYKASAAWMPKAFESRKTQQSDYNKFMQLNMATARVAFTKDEAAAGACVVDAFLVTQGSLPSVEINSTTNAWYTNLQLGDLAISADTTNAQLTQALLANNANVREGMQISFVSYQQSIDAMGIPRVICRLYEITLSSTSTDKVRDFLPDFCSQSVNQCLGTSANISTGAFAYIVSEKVNGKLRVSTQQLIAKNNDLLNQFSDPAHIREAMLSYGLDGEVILSPDGTNDQTAEAQPISISNVKIGDTTYRGGEYYGAASGVKGKSITVNFVNAPGVTPVNFVIETTSGTPVTITEVMVNEKSASVSVPSGAALSGNLSKIAVTFQGGKSVAVNFSTYSGGGGGGMGGDL